MAKKNRLSKMQAQHAFLLKREEEQKVKKKRKVKPRLIPKNLVRGASKDPSLFQEALKKMKKKRNPPKKMEIDREKRVVATQQRGKAARHALIEKRRLQ